MVDSVTPEKGCCVTTRSEHAFNLNWARQNPERFVDDVANFQRRFPVPEFRHFVDLSREHFVELIAVRRDQPFDSVTDYAMDAIYLTETGYD